MLKPTVSRQQKARIFTLKMARMTIEEIARIEKLSPEAVEEVLSSFGDTAEVRAVAQTMEQTIKRRSRKPKNPMDEIARLLDRPELLKQ